MEKYLSKFTNLSDYINFRNTDMPEINVSYVESVDRVIYYSEDKVNKNFYFKVLNPENISQWDTDENGKEYININPIGSLTIRVYYMTNGELRGSDNNVFKLYKDSDYTITVLYQEAGGNPGVKDFGNILDNTFGLKYKVGGNINSWFRMNNEDLSTFVLPSDWDYTQYNNLFSSNKYVLDFSDLYIPVGENYKYNSMFASFNLDPNDTLLMPDFYFDKTIQAHFQNQFTGMFSGLPNTNFSLYITDKKIYNGVFGYMFSGSTFTNTPNIMIEAYSPGEINFERWFENCSNLTTPWFPEDTSKLPGQIHFDSMYINCPLLRDLSSYMVDTTDHVFEDLIWEYIYYNSTFELSEAPVDGTTGLTKGLKIKTDRWDRITVNNMYKNQTNLTEIYLLGPDLAKYGTGGRGGERLNDSDNFPAAGTVYVTDTNITINELNAKFGIPTTWTLAIYSE